MHSPSHSQAVCSCADPVSQLISLCWAAGRARCRALAELHCTVFFVTFELLSVCSGLQAGPVVEPETEPGRFGCAPSTLSLPLCVVGCRQGLLWSLSEATLPSVRSWRADPRPWCCRSCASACSTCHTCRWTTQVCACHGVLLCVRRRDIKTAAAVQHVRRQPGSISLVPGTLVEVQLHRHFLCSHVTNLVALWG